MGSVTALVGAQFGSEGKGLVAAKMAWDYDVHVRTGAPNAGHTYYDLIGNKIVARSVPCGALNPDAKLILGPGAFIDLELLASEIEGLEALGWVIRDRLFIDASASLIHPVRHHQLEGGVHGDAHRLIGSTGEGVGPARMARLARGTFPRDQAWARLELVGDATQGAERLGTICDTAKLVNDLYDAGSDIMLEGTQGSGLSVVHGPWPYVTSTDTNAGQMATDAGLAPGLVDEVILVARTFPIRVAGNSGPLPRETEWALVGQAEERTTVTKKVRRVGWFHEETVRRAMMLNRPRSLVLTFLDYLFPSDAGAEQWMHLSDEAREFVASFEIKMGIDVSAVGTGPDSMPVNSGIDRTGPAGRFLSSSPQDVPGRYWPAHGEAYDADAPVVAS